MQFTNFREILFTAWFLISPFIILTLYLKLRNVKNIGEGLLEKLQEGWDLEYKNIISQYGSTKNFLSLMTNDFRNVRNTGASYLAIFDATLSKINELSKINSNVTKSELINILNNILLVSSFSIHESKEYLNYLVNEETLHDYEVKVEEYYNSIKARQFDAFEMHVVAVKDNKDSKK